MLSILTAYTDRGTAQAPLCPLCFNHPHLSSALQKKRGLSAPGCNKCACRWKGSGEWGVFLSKMLKYSGQSVYVYINIFRQAAAGGVRSKKHWYALFVFLHHQRHAVSLHEAISYLISTDTHSSKVLLLLILIIIPPLFSFSSGASQLILHHFIFLLYCDGKWLTIIFFKLSFLIHTSFFARSAINRLWQ